MSTDRSSWAAVLALILACVPVAGLAFEGARYNYSNDDQLYAACYIFTAGESTAFVYPTFKTTGKEMGNYFEKNLRDVLIPQNPQHHSIRCMVGDSADEAASLLSRHNYVYEPRPWPKGLPDAARPVYVAGKGYVPKGSLGTVQSAPLPKPAPPPKPTPSVGLIVAEDTSAKDAAKAWDNQVKTALAAEAKRRVETAARAAQADAELKRRIEAFFAERLRQGSGQ